MNKTKTKYKVLIKNGSDLNAPFQDHFKYELNKWYHCADFDDNKSNDCSTGFYATDPVGLLYVNLSRPNSVVVECQVKGKEVLCDKYFKHRYEHIRIKRILPKKELIQLLKKESKRVGFNVEIALLPKNPIAGAPKQVKQEHIELLKVWNSVRNSVSDSVSDSVLNSVSGSVWAYVSCCFPKITQWKYIEHKKGENPFQSCIDLWNAGFVPSFDGRIWRLHSGKDATVVFEIKKEEMK